MYLSFEDKIFKVYTQPQLLKPLFCFVLGIYRDVNSSQENEAMSSMQELQISGNPSGAKIKVGNFFPTEGPENLMCDIEIRNPLL